MRENANVTKNYANVDSTLALSMQITSFNTSALWKKIFYNTNVTNKEDITLVNEIMKIQSFTVYKYFLLNIIENFNL